MNVMPPRREPNGRRQRASTAQDRLNELNRAREQAEIATVLAQPHRQGEKSPMAESAIGRFVLQNAMQRELYDAAVEYARTRGMWLSVMGAPRAEHHGGSGGDVPEELAHKWRDDVAEWRRAMGEAGGKEGAAAIEIMACDNAELPPRFERLAAMSALIALGKVMGRI